MITSHRNPLIKKIRRLRQKKYRQQERAFFAEGLRVVISAAEKKAPVEAIVYCSKYLTSNAAWQMISEQRSAGNRCEELSPDVFDSISPRDHPAGLGAIIESSRTDLSDISIKNESIIVALFDIAEPGNLGTIIRTSEAVGVDGLILVGDTVDPYHPTAVKASMGSLFSIAICQVANADELQSWASGHGFNTVATSAKATVSYRQADYQLPALLMMGSERFGLPENMQTSCDIAVSIPMKGDATSLNLAVAAGLMLYELRYQQLVSSG